MDSKKQIVSYFNDALGIKPNLNLWQPARRLPIFLRNGYVYYEMELLDQGILVMLDTSDGQTPGTIEKHIQQVKAKWPGKVVYSRAQITSHERRDLIKRKISFVIPGNQMYLPLLGIDLREYFRKPQEPVEKFSPATQAVFLLLLTDALPKTYMSQDLIQRLDYSKMTVSRSLNDLKSIGVIQMDGRTRVLSYDGDRRDLWERALPYLESPVKQSIHLKGRPDLLQGKLAGYTALSKRSMLADAGRKTIAMDQDDLQQLTLTDGIRPAQPDDPDAVRIEVWSYDPTSFDNNGMVDPFSLFLSLCDVVDERVESALEEMMEAVSW